MRMWNVDPRILCDKHLLGEHVEMHMFAGCIQAGKSIQGYLDKGLVEPNNILRRHSLLAAEMRQRGMKHRSELKRLQAHPQNGWVDSFANLKELARRCSACRRKQATYKRRAQ